MEEGWVRVASTTDLREGTGFDTGVEVAKEIVGLFMLDGAYYAVGECTHERGPICQGHIEGSAVTCPWHSAKFNVKTGEKLQGPVACRTSGSVLSGSEMVEVDEIDHLVCFDVQVKDQDIYVRPRN
jgi:nitrite reductase/ring-hydroxylating ferredoxin subunit